MAQYRMIGKTVIQTQKFLRLPLETQALYFHLLSGTDDDGVVEAFPIVRMIGASEDSLGLLVIKNFIKPLNDEMVYFVVDFHEQNTIRKDRYKPSKYKPLINLKLNDNQMTTTWQPNDNQMTAQDKLSKDKLSKDNTPEINRASLDQIEYVSESEILHNTQMKKKFKEYSDLYPKKTKKREAFEAFKNLSEVEISKLMIGVKNIAVFAKSLTPQEFNYLKNQATFITDETYLDYQVLRSNKQEAPIGSKSPEWYEPNYVNETTPEEQLELDRIKQEILEKTR